MQFFFRSSYGNQQNNTSQSNTGSDYTPKGDPRSNYDNLPKRNQHLPNTVTKQNIVIDARGQGITYSQEQEIIQKIIDKSNGTIKKSDITIWK